MPLCESKSQKPPYAPPDTRTRSCGAGRKGVRFRRVRNQGDSSAKTEHYYSGLRVLRERARAGREQKQFAAARVEFCQGAVGSLTQSHVVPKYLEMT
jgi:hypothetical protein